MADANHTLVPDGHEPPTLGPVNDEAKARLARIFNRLSLEAKRVLCDIASEWSRQTAEGEN